MKPIEVHDEEFHSYVFLSDDGKQVARFEINGVYEDKGAMWGEVSVYYMYDGTGDPIVRFKRTNLIGTIKNDVRNELVEKDKNWQWEAWAETALSTTVEHRRKPVKAIALREQDYIDTNAGFLLDPIILGRGVSLLYAPGGTGKSMIALAAMVAVASGREVFGLQPADIGACLFVDYEDDIRTHELRLAAILKGMDMTMADLQYPIHHIKPRQKISNMRRDLNAHIRDLNPRLIVIDSVGLARGGDANTSEDTINAFRTMSLLNTSVLALDHVTKEDVRSGKTMTPYGSVYTLNSVRLAWGMKQKDISDASNSYIDMVQTKRNNVAAHEPLVVHIKYLNLMVEVGELGSVQPVLQSIKFMRLDGFGVPVKEESGRVTNIDKAITELKKGKPLSTLQLSEKLKCNKKSLGLMLSREARKPDPRIERVKVKGQRATGWLEATRRQQLPPMTVETGKESEETQ